MWRSILLVPMAQKKYTITATFLIQRKNNRCVSLLWLSVHLTQKKRPTFKVCDPQPPFWFKLGGRTSKRTPRHTVIRRGMKRQATCHPLSPSTTMWGCRCGPAPTKMITLSNSERKSYRNNKLWTAIMAAINSLPNSTHIMSIMCRLLRNNQLLTSSTICGAIIRKGRSLSLIWQTSTYNRSLTTLTTLQRRLWQLRRSWLLRKTTGSSSRLTLLRLQLTSRRGRQRLKCQDSGQLLLVYLWFKQTTKDLEPM